MLKIHANARPSAGKSAPFHGNFPCSLIWFCVAVGIIFLRCANGNCWRGTGNETSIKLERVHTNRKSFIIEAHSALRFPLEPISHFNFLFRFLAFPLNGLLIRDFCSTYLGNWRDRRESAERKRKLQVRSEMHQMSSESRPFGETEKNKEMGMEMEVEVEQWCRHKGKPAFPAQKPTSDCRINYQPGSKCITHIKVGN